VIIVAVLEVEVCVGIPANVDMGAHWRRLAFRMMGWNPTTDLEGVRKRAAYNGVQKFMVLDKVVRSKVIPFYSVYEAVEMDIREAEDFN